MDQPSTEWIYEMECEEQVDRFSIGTVYLVDAGDLAFKFVREKDVETRKKLGEEIRSLIDKADQIFATVEME